MTTNQLTTESLRRAWQVAEGRDREDLEREILDIEEAQQ